MDLLNFVSVYSTGFFILQIHSIG